MESVRDLTRRQEASNGQGTTRGPKSTHCVWESVGLSQPGTIAELGNIKQVCEAREKLINAFIFLEKEVPMEQ